MGGRGASSSGGAGGAVKTVPYDKWGKDIEIQPIYEMVDGEKTQIGYIEDETRYISEPYIRPVTKKEILNDIDGYRNDDGTYGDEDTSINFAYKDGSFVSADDLNGKAYKKSGLIGVSISTGDYESSWGGDIDKRTGKFRPWGVMFDNGEDMEEKQGNWYSSYKTTGAYKQRVKTTFNNPNGKGGYKTKREIIKKSTVKKID